MEDERSVVNNQPTQERPVPIDDPSDVWLGQDRFCNLPRNHLSFGPSICRYQVIEFRGPVVRPRSNSIDVVFSHRSRGLPRPQINAYEIDSGRPKIRARRNIKPPYRHISAWRYLASNTGQHESRRLRNSSHAANTWLWPSLTRWPSPGGVERCPFGGGRRRPPSPRGGGAPLDTLGTLATSWVLYMV